MKRRRRASGRLRSTTSALPRHTREAMLRGIEENRIIVGAYTDGEGGVCPMLAAHRNGGRTSFASFARAWDEFTGAGRRSRRATRREIRVLRSYLEISLLGDGDPPSPASAGKDPPRRSRVPADRFLAFDLRRKRSRQEDRSTSERGREPVQAP